MTYADICDAVTRIKRKYVETDPFRLCRAMDIKLIFEPMGKDPDAPKGFFLECKRIRTITVNSDLPEVIQKIIVAHEIGHALFHRKTGIHAFHDITMFDQNSVMEKEANLFAAEYILEDQKVFEVLNRDTTFFSAAAALYVPAELLDFKFRLMKWKGYKLTEPPISARSNFLRDVEVPENADYYS